MISGSCGVTQHANLIHHAVATVNARYFLALRSLIANTLFILYIVLFGGLCRTIVDGFFAIEPFGGHFRGDLGVFVLFALLLAVVLHVAVLAKALRVHVFVRTAHCWLGSPSLVVTILAHAFRIEFSIYVVTRRDFLLFPLDR